MTQRVAKALAMPASRAPAHETSIPEPLDDDLKRLCDFGVASGGTIVVDEMKAEA